MKELRYEGAFGVMYNNGDDAKESLAHKAVDEWVRDERTAVGVISYHNLYEKLKGIYG